MPPGHRSAGDSDDARNLSFFLRATYRYPHADGVAGCGGGDDVWSDPETLPLLADPDLGWSPRETP